MMLNPFKIKRKNMVICFSKKIFFDEQNYFFFTFITTHWSKRSTPSKFLSQYSQHAQLRNMLPRQGQEDTRFSKKIVIFFSCFYIKKYNKIQEYINTIHGSEISNFFKHFTYIFNIKTIQKSQNFISKTKQSP